MGGELYKNVQAFIAQEQSDIIALQEVYNTEEYPPLKAWHVVGSLARSLGYKYHAFAPACGKTTLKGAKVLNGNAILSRYPIRSAPVVFYDVPYNGTYIDLADDARQEPRNLQQAEIMINDTVLYFFNTQGIWGFDGEDSQRRLNMGDIIAQAVAGKTPALLMGDFNIQEGTKTTDKIEAHMKSVFKGELKSSFNMKHKTKSGYASAIVDMMFATPDIAIGRHYASAADVSDHLALVAEFEIPVS